MPEVKRGYKLNRNQNKRMGILNPDGLLEDDTDYFKRYSSGPNNSPSLGIDPTNRDRGMLGPDKDESVPQVPSNFLGGMQPQHQYNDNKLMQMGADREVQDEFLAQTKLNRSDGTSWDDFKQDASDMYGKAKDYLSGATADKEGAESAYNWQDPNKKEEMYGNPAFQVAAQQRESELGQWGDIAKYDMPESPAQQIAGSGTGHHPESMMPAPQSLLADQVGTGDQHGGQLLDSLADSPEATESTALTGKEKAMIKMGTGLLDSGKDSPTQRAPVGALKMGKVPFPSLLASQSQPKQRYIHKGLG